MKIDWPALRAAAVGAAARAYAPYSGLRVGAAGQAANGHIVTGCNVENASYGLTLCAECGVVSAFYASGGGAFYASGGGAFYASGGGAFHASDAAPHASGAGPRLVAVAIVAGDGKPLLPCGRCRQLLLEAGGGDVLIDGIGGPVELSILLPDAFTPVDLAQRRESR